MTTPAIELSRVSKTFGAFKAVREVSLQVQPGEFFSLLGPSGCGKTTTLRLVAGFEEPDEDGGELRLGGQKVNNLRPYERNLSMVFQSYALFPHMSIEANVAFGLEQRGVSKAEIPARVRRALEMVQLDPGTYATRKPGQLSGGQRQRVALARALVVEPPILLLDEPLGALDLKLRKEMQVELKELNKRLGITFLYVTHDQEEALTMSDRIAIMSQARVAQLGSPAEIYERPRTPFVARFIGESCLLEGDVVGAAGDAVELKVAGGVVKVPGSAQGRRTFALRPERLELRAEAPEGWNSLPGTISRVIYRGESLHVRVALEGGGELTAAPRNEGQLQRPFEWSPGHAVRVCWRVQDGQLLESD